MLKLMKKSIPAHVIHAEFLSINNQYETNVDDVDLKKFGFKNKQTEDYATKKIIKALRNNFIYNKFITEEQINFLCKKYNLRFGKTAAYLGEVPIKNKKEIQNFDDSVVNKLKKANLNYNHFYYGICRVDSIISLNTEELNIYNNTTIKQIYDVSRTRIRDNYRDFEDISRTFIRQPVKEGYFIAAPEAEMDKKLSANSVNAFEKLFKPKVDDPIVFHPMQGGYLIVTAWGDEAADSLVFDPINN